MLSVVNRVFNRVPWFFIILFILIFWLFQGKTALAPGDAAANYVTEQTRKLMTMDPAAGARLAALARERDIHALAVSLRTYDSNTGGNGVRAVMADLSRPGGGDLDWYAIGHVGMHPEAFSTADERLQFARSHGQAYRTLLNADATGEAAARYAISLTSAERKGGAAWAVIRDDPSALFARHHLEDDEEAWAYFCREREWLAPILSVLGSEEFDGEWLPSPVLEVTNVARRYDPLVQTVYRELHGGDISTLPNPELGRLVLDMFDRFGELFSACRQLDVPLTETVAIMFANPERFDFSDIPGLRTEQCRENAAKLAHIHRNKPAVWTAALEESNVLWLEEHAPEQAERLMSQYAGNNIASLIFTYYEDMPAHAAEAVAAFGDFGIDMLTRYQDHPEFRQYLRHEKVGVRIIPFMLRFPKDGFAILSDGNYLWIDKYFHADGSVKDQGWIKDIPLVGGPANVARNWANGVPNTWGEIGWAAFDVADVVLLAVTLGGSSPATAAKEATKQGGKAVVRQMSKQAAKQVATQASRKALAGAAARATTRATARVSVGQVLRTTGSLMIRAAQIAGSFASYAVQPIRWAGNAAWRGITATHRAWSTLPSWAKRGITGAIGFMMLAHSWEARNTPDAIKRMFADIGKTMGETVAAVKDGTVEGFANALTEMMKSVRKGTSTVEGVWIYGLWLVPSVLLAVLAWWLRPTRRSFQCFIRGF